VSKLWGMTQIIPSDSRATVTENTGAEDFRPSLVDRALAAGARAIDWIPDPVLSLLSRRNADGDRLDGDVGFSLLSLKVVGGKDISEQNAVDARRNVDRQGYLAGSGGPASLPVASVEHRRIAGVRVRVYTPDGTGGADAGSPAPAVIYLHGGGWVTGSLDSHDSTCRYLCDRGDVRVISVDYRMAPEHPFPAPLDDVVDVVSAALAGEIPEVDPAKVVVAGDSAGGHLTAATCLRLRAEGKPQPALQMLFVPVVDQRDVDEVKATHASRREFADGPYLTEAHFRWYDKAFLPDFTAEQRADELVSPLLASSLEGLAPAYVAVAGHDPLRDEGEAYALRLAEAGVPVTVRRHRGLVHPFVNSTAIWQGSRRALDEAVGALRNLLGITGK
jgi:acetyl esterase